MLERLRNIGIVAHIDAGKTTLAERILYYCGRIHQIREVRGSDGGATMDSSPIEKKHGITIASAATRVEWNDHFINLIDTPGHVDFTVEVERSLRVLDGGVLVACATSGVQSQTAAVFQQMQRHNVPGIAFVNKMDLQGASPESVVEELRSKLRCNAQPIQFPIGVGDTFSGVIDLVGMKQVSFHGEFGQEVRYAEIEKQFMASAEDARNQMLEALALVDEAILNELLNEREPAMELVAHAIRSATCRREFTPVLFGSAYKNIGVQPLLTAVTDYLPAPSERTLCAEVANGHPASQKGAVGEEIQLLADPARPAVALAFKTVVSEFGQLTYLRVYQGCLRKGVSYWSAYMAKELRFGRLVRLHAGQLQEVDSVAAGEIAAVVGLDCPNGDTFCGEGVRCRLEGIQAAQPVVSLTIAAERREHATRLAKALDRIRREDPTFRVNVDPVTAETVISGMGRLHLDVIIERIESEFGCVCSVGQPSVAYRQAPTRRVEFNYKRNKQTGGPGQYGHIIGYAEPLELTHGDGFTFEHEITSGRIPSQYLSSIESGFRKELGKGPLGKFDVVGLRIVVTDGSYHPQDSSDMAFQACAAEALRNDILPRANCKLLEPFMSLHVELPSEFVGPVSGHLHQIRGRIVNSDFEGQNCSIDAEVPLAELFDYSSDLRSLTKGNGTFSMELASYQACTSEVQSKLLAS